MDIYLGNLAPGISAYDLRRLIRELGAEPMPARLRWLSPLWYRRTWDQFRVRLVERRGARGVVHFGLASIEPATRARQCMARLNGHRVHDRPLVAHEYVYRSSMNERRALDWRAKAWISPERRTGRRRGHNAH